MSMEDGVFSFVIVCCLATLSIVGFFINNRILKIAPGVLIVVFLLGYWFLKKWGDQIGQAVS